MAGLLAARSRHSVLAYESFEESFLPLSKTFDPGNWKWKYRKEKKRKEKKTKDPDSLP